jgi:hypothetical protein
MPATPTHKAIAALEQARAMLGRLRGQPCTVIAADRTLGDIARAIDLAINDLDG